MVDREAIERENKRLVSRLKFASLRQSRAQHYHGCCPGSLIGAKTGHFCATLCQEV